MELEFRILVATEVRWIHCMALATRNARGEVVRWTGAARDITDLNACRKRRCNFRQQKRRQHSAWRRWAHSPAEFCADDFPNNILGAILGDK